MIQKGHTMKTKLLLLTLCTVWQAHAAHGQQRALFPRTVEKIHALVNDANGSSRFRYTTRQKAERDAQIVQAITAFNFLRNNWNNTTEPDTETYAALEKYGLTSRGRVVRQNVRAAGQYLGFDIWCGYVFIY